MTPITNYPKYSINTDGEIFSSHKTGNRRLKQAELKCGYLRVVLCSGSGKTYKEKRYSVHRLVAEQFLPNPLNLPYVNHIDNDRGNSKLSNLEWCTHSENMRHCHKQGHCSNLAASEKSRLKNEARMLTKFQNLLGDNFIGFVPIPPGTKRARRHVIFICDSCKTTYTARSDSSTFRTNCLCFTCAR